MKIKIVKRYSVRFYPTKTSYSKAVGFKHKLIERKKALAVVKRLKKSGVDAFAEPMEIKIAA